MRYLNDLHALDLVLFFQWAIHAVVALVAVSVRSSLNTLNTWQIDFTEEVCKVYLFRSSFLHTCAGHFFCWSRGCIDDVNTQFRNLAERLLSKV